ncbi:uncharacterized protein LOC126902899 [Daktulosphaira vitifoliae]|uniref:uncharacterized protein LOC126902899 n=1 Tax=Daktulosphaira vitifoliae TaxID=58002 RepID=UPI0021AA8B05|nr:uncharacterized protein LOC126902899 [Daktulosphaira vitifoliae]
MKISRTLLISLVASFLVVKTEQHWKVQYKYKPYQWSEGSYPLKYTIGFKTPPAYTSNGESTSLYKSEGCDLHKAVFTQGTHLPQYIVYKSKIPDLKEFTLCHWHNIFNYTHDHPIFSYSSPGKHRLIYSWIENSPEKTYYNLAINGHTIYRMNYPEKLFKWYHVCQSWNGHTGEWQLWINSERVGRGFYNLMVGKLIVGGGIAISGREYLDHQLAAGGAAYAGELTLLSFYKAALTAGKAYNDHKHHHVHNFHHGYDPAIDEADDEAEEETPSTPEPTLPPHLAHGEGFINGQRDHNLPVSELVIKDLNKGQIEQHQKLNLFDGGLYDFYSPFKSDSFDEFYLANGLERRSGGKYKRNTTSFSGTQSQVIVKTDDQERNKRWIPITGDRNGRVGRYYEIKHRKSLQSSRLEPAEWEVNKVAEICRSCVPDPFSEATIISWEKSKKQFYNGALYTPAQPKCYSF